jgi:hypothetical protein
MFIAAFFPIDKPKKMEILSFGTMWMNMEYITLSRISQAQKENATWSHLCVESREGNWRRRERVWGQEVPFHSWFFLPLWRSICMKHCNVVLLVYFCFCCFVL